MRTTTWRKSSRSGATPGGQCVEVRLYEGTTMQVRDTKLANSPILDVDAASWGTFLAQFAK